MTYAYIKLLLYSRANTATIKHMTTILPISDLRNYGEVLSQVDSGKPVYLTRNGRGTYVISKIDDFDKEAAIEQLVVLIRKGEESLKEHPPVPIEDIAKKYKVRLQ